MAPDFAGGSLQSGRCLVTCGICGMAHAMYTLSSHTHVCFDREFCVFLDLESDQYSCVTRVELEPLRPYLLDAPKQSVAPAQGEPSSLETEPTLLTEFVRRGLLTRADSDSRPFFATRCAPVTTPYLTRAEKRLCARWGRYALPVLAAATRAHWSLEHHPLKSVVRRVARRKANRPAVDLSWDADRMRTLIASFEAVRPYFPRDHLCLFDSLALIELLAFYGFHPMWVFGVHAEPFAAHCWVQAGTTALNDFPERVCSYVPIMTV